MWRTKKKIEAVIVKLWVQQNWTQPTWVQLILFNGVLNPRPFLKFWVEAPYSVDFVSAGCHGMSPTPFFQFGSALSPLVLLRSIPEHIVHTFILGEWVGRVEFCLLACFFATYCVSACHVFVCNDLNLRQAMHSKKYCIWSTIKQFKNLVKEPLKMKELSLWITHIAYKMQPSLIVSLLYHKGNNRQIHTSRAGIKFLKINSVHHTNSDIMMRSLAQVSRWNNCFMDKA